MFPRIVLYYSTFIICLVKYVALSGSECEYEAAECGWHFDSPALEDHKRLDPRHNFKVLQPSYKIPTRSSFVTMKTTRKEPAMILSPYYQHLSKKCKLRFSYQGQATKIEVVVEYSQDALGSAKGQARKKDTFLNPHIFQRGWEKASVDLEPDVFPARIRLECSSIAKDKRLMQATPEELDRLTQAKCVIDNIQLSGCEEEVYDENVCQSNHVKKYLCTRNGTRKCIDYDQLCDFSQDCADQEDEEENCANIPKESWCDFEYSIETGCEDWTVETHVGGQPGYKDTRWFELVSMPRKNDDHARLRLPEHDHSYHGNASGVKGHYFYFPTRHDDRRSNITAVLSSAYMQPFDHKSYDPHRSPCKVRFYYCLIAEGENPLVLTIHPKTKQAIKLWQTREPFYDRNRGPCNWTRVSTEIPPQDEPYRVGFSIVTRFVNSTVVALDDISLSLGCFHDGEIPFPAREEKRDMNGELARPTYETQWNPHQSTTRKTSIIQQVDSVTTIPAFANRNLLIMATAFSFGAVIFFLLFGWCCLHLYRRFKKEKKKDGLLGAEINLKKMKDALPVSVSRNPIYESLGITTDLKTIPRQNITFKNALGEGAFGEVFAGVLLENGKKTEIAIKSLPQTTSKEAIDDFEMEALIMSKFEHQNICNFKGVCFERSPHLIVLELLAGGDLKTFLRESRLNKNKEEALEMTDLLRMAEDVAKGCKYLADNRFIHRDIAARNCLLTKKEKGRVVKIADFGMARDIYRQEYYRKGGKSMLPIKWMPPEAFIEGIFTSKTDVWSYGVLLWEIFSLGYVPYPGRNNHEVMTLIVEGSRLGAPAGVPEEVYNLMLDCWKTNDAERPDFDVILNNLENLIRNPIVCAMPVTAQFAVPASALNTPGLSGNSDLTPTLNAITNDLVDIRRPEVPPSSNITPPAAGYGVNVNACAPFASRAPEGLVAGHLSPMSTSVNDLLL